MASLNWYLKKFGTRAGRKAYNAYHRAYNHQHRNAINKARRNARRQRAK